MLLFVNLWATRVTFLTPQQTSASMHILICFPGILVDVVVFLHLLIFLAIAKPVNSLSSWGRSLSGRPCSSPPAEKSHCTTEHLLPVPTHTQSSPTEDQEVIFIYHLLIHGQTNGKVFPGCHSAWYGKSCAVPVLWMSKDGVTERPWIHAYRHNGLTPMMLTVALISGAFHCPGRSHSIN